MNVVSDILARLKTKLEMVDTSTLYSDPTLISIISDAHIWAGDQHAWPQNEKAKRSLTTAVAGIVDEYYDYPSEFKSDSIYMLEVNGVTYDPKSWDSYKNVKKNNSISSNENIFATYGRQFFLNHVPSAAGLPIDAHGQIQAPPLVNLGDKTIFSDSEASLNEGILLKAFSVCITGDKKESLNQELLASVILAKGFKTIVARRQRFQETNMPRFDVPDMFVQGGGRQFVRGNIG